MKPEVRAGLKALAEWAEAHPETFALLECGSAESMSELDGLLQKRLGPPSREYQCCVELAGPSFRPCLIGFGEDDYPLREKLKRGLGKVVYVTVRIEDEPPEGT